MNKVERLSIGDAPRGTWLRLECGCVVARKSPLSISKATGGWVREVAGGPIIKERKEAWHVELAQPCRNAPVGKLTKHYVRRNRVGDTIRAQGCRVRRSLNTREFFVYSTTGIVVQDQLAMELSKFG